MDTTIYEPYILWTSSRQRKFCIDNLLVRIHVIIVMIQWTGLAPWELKFPYPGSLTSTFQGQLIHSISQGHSITQRISVQILEF